MPARHARIGCASRAHAPFEDAKRCDQYDEDAVLQHLDIAETLEEADVTERPDLRIGTQEQKHGEHQE